MSGLKLPSINTKTLQASTFSRGVYDPKAFVTPVGFVPLDMKDFTATSPDFAAAAYVNPKTGELVVAYRGSDSKTDLVIAQQAASGGKWNAQFTDAANFAVQAKSLASAQVSEYADKNGVPEYLRAEVTPLYTGHSLGGLLATVTSKMFGNEAVVFDAPGGGKLLSTPEFAEVATANNQPAAGYDVSDKIQNFTVTSVISGLGEPMVERTWLPVLGQPSFTEGLITLGSVAVNPALGLVVGGATKVVDAHSSVTIEEAMYTLAGLQPHLPNAGPLTVQNMYVGTDGKPTASSYRSGEEPGGTTRVQALVDERGNAVAYIDQDAGKPVAVVVSSGTRIAIENRVELEQKLDATNPSGINAVNGMDLQSDHFKPSASTAAPAASGVAPNASWGGEANHPMVPGTPTQAVPNSVAPESTGATGLRGSAAPVGSVNLDGPAGSFWPNALDATFEFKGSAGERDDSWSLTSDQLRERYGADKIPKPGAPIDLAATGSGTLTDGGLINGFGSGASAVGTSPAESQVQVGNVFSFNNGTVAPVAGTGGLQTNSDIAAGAAPRSRSGTGEVLSDGPSAFVAGVEAGASSAVTNIPGLAGAAGKIAPGAAYVGAINDTINVGQHVLKGNGAEAGTEILGGVGQASGAFAGGAVLGELGLAVGGPYGGVLGSLVGAGLGAYYGADGWKKIGAALTGGDTPDKLGPPQTLPNDAALQPTITTPDGSRYALVQVDGKYTWFSMLDNSGLAVANQYVEVTRGAQIAELTNNYLGASGFAQQVATHNAQVAADNTQIAQDTFIRSEINTQNATAPNGQPYGTPTQTAPNANQIWNQTSQPGLDTRTTDVRNGDGSVTRIVENINRSTGKVDSVRTYENDNGANPNSPDSFHLVGLIDNTTGVTQAVNRDTGQMEQIAGPSSTATTKPTVFNPATALSNSNADHTITVLAGDTVTSIAKRWGMAPAAYEDYLREQYGPNADLNSIVAGRKLPLPSEVYDRTMGGVNGLDLPAESNNDGSDAHFNHHLTTDAAPKGDATTGGNDATTQQIIDAFSKPVVISKENDVQLADASSATGTGTRTASDAGTGGIGLGNATKPNASEPNQPVALVNNGDNAPDSIAITGPDGSDAHFQHHPASSIAVPLAEGLTLVNTLIGLKNWDKQSDLSHLGTAVNLYNQVTQFAGVSGPLGNLGQFGAGIGFITTLQGNNPIAMASSGSSLANSLAGAEIIPIPFINALNIGSALQSGDPFAVASSVASCFPPWGTVASVVISILGGLRKPDIPPPPDGAVHYTWDENGAIQTQTDHDVSGGAATANSTAGSVLGLLQSVVTDHNAKNDTAGHSNNNLGIDPSRMPRIGFTAGMSWLEITHADGSTTKETINPATVGERLLQIAVENDALAPVWQIQTAQAHAKAEHAAQVEAQAQAQATATTDQSAPENTNAIDGQTPVTAPASTTASTVHNTAAVFGLEGKVQEASDHKTQTFSALVVHLHSPTAQDAVAAIGTPKTNTVLQDVDGDGFWEQTQWVASKDDAGNAQGMLVLDRNNNGVIDATDILHLGGNSNEHNSLAWLDANGDGVLNASDPAFAAIKVFIDLNSDGRVDDGEMQSPQLSSIDFTTGQINYTEGPSATLSATTLSGDTEGIKLDHMKVVGEDGELQELKVGSVLIHEGYQGQVRVNSRGEIVADDDPATDTHLVSKRTPSYEFNAAHLSDWEGTAEQDQHRHGGTNVAGAPTETSVTGVSSMGAVLGKDNVKTTTTMDVGDKRITSDAPKTQVPSDTAAPNTTITLNAGDARIRSLTPAENAQRVVFVPSGVRDGWMTADGKELLQLPDDGLFGTGGMAGALMAVALGAVQSTAFAKADPDETGFTWQTRPLVLDGAGGSNSNGGSSTNAGDAGTLANQPSTIALGNYATVHRVRLGVRLSAAPPADASAPSYTTTETGTARTSNTQTPAGATNYASANPSSPDANTAPTQTLIDNQLPTNAKTPANTMATPPADPTSNTESVAPADPTTSTTSPATPSPTAPVPPGPTLVATPPTAPAAVTPTTGNDQLGNNPLEDATLHVSFATLMANDVNASSITAVGNATHGSVAIIGGEVVFTPSQNYHGPASFVYQVVSTDGNFALGQADFDISGVNDVPVVLGETSTANEDVALVLSQATLLTNDSDVDVATDGQTLSISAVGNASHGTVSILGNGSVQFNPDANFHGTASFKYVVSDGQGGSATATATVQVAAVNDLPVGLGEVISSAEDTTLLVSQAALLANDTDADVATDGQTLSVSAVSNASHGTVSILGNGQVQFIPTANYSGTASFDYVVNDGAGGTATATATVLVGSTDDAPVASGETVNGQEDQVVTLTAAALLANETDIDNTVSSLSISRVTAGAGGSAVLNASGNVVFTPNANFSGTASLTYWVKDPDGMESNPATVTLNVAPVNDSPYAQGEVLSGASEDAVFNIDRMALLGNDGDEEDSNSSLSIELVGNASSGTVAMGAGGNVVYTPTANFNGNVSFQYQVRDTSGAASPTVTAQFNVAAVNDTPLGVDETLTPMYTNTAASPSTATVGFSTLLSNDSDVDNPPTDLTVSGVRNASNGTVSIVSGAVSFTPTLNFNGTASFEYQVNDQHGGQTWATAFISVAPPPNLYPSVNVTYANFYPTGTTPAGAFDMGDVSFSLADDGNAGLVSITYQSGSYHVFGDPGGPVGGLPWNTFTYSQTGWNIDIPRSSAVDSFDTTWQIVDDRGLANVWHFGYTVGSGTRTSMDFTGYAPPVVLGLHGDVPHYIETYNSNVRFDLNGDGIADQVAWAAPGSGVLGIDLNGDHLISNANEFSFTQYVPGAKTDLQGLHAFDTNHNGVLDAGDAQWAKFGVWEDKDSDGQTQEGEYQTLDQLGIASIDLTGHAPTTAATPEVPDANGHLSGVAVVGTSTFARTDGSTGQVDDAMFAFTTAPVASQSQEAEVMRMALLFNQMCNTANDGDLAALGFVPIQVDHHWQDAVVAVPQSALHESFN